MRTLRKLLAGIGLAGMLSLGVIWGSYAPPVRQAVSLATEYIQKPGHVVLADLPPQNIQKPGH
jgi:hypothetical protein